MHLRRLPHDLFYSHILPDLLSDHLHRVLVQLETPAWHPFYTLPLVSRDFHATCQMLCIGMFGLMPGEGGRAILDILGFAQSLWEQANLPPDRALPILEYNYEQLMSSHSLIQVYMCAALAKSYLNLDVLWHLELEQRRNSGEFVEDTDDDMDAEPHMLGLNTAVFSRRFKMRDDNMHRVFLPLTCAMRLCDRLRPERVAYVAADYLASIVPFYTTAPVMLKYTQDLENYVAREHRLEMEEMWVNWTSQTLQLVSQSHRLLEQMQEMGKLVKSFKYSSSIPLEVLQGTNILRALDGVANADWGLHTDELKELAIWVQDELLGREMPIEVDEED